MIVVDASAMIEFLLRLPKAGQVAGVMVTHGRPICAPHLIDIEVLHGLRRYDRAGRLAGQRAEEAFTDFAALSVVCYPHERLRDSIWRLRHNLTAYDAAYVALAEVLDAPLLTCDARLAAAPGHTARIELV